MRNEQLCAIACVAVLGAITGCSGGGVGSTKESAPAVTTMHLQPGTSIKDAVDALPSTGGVIMLAQGTYTSGYDSVSGAVLTKQNVKIYGVGMPSLNSQTAPTALTGGTIIQGEFGVAGYSPNGSANGFEMHNLGIDVGQDVVNSLYAGVAHNGLAIANMGQAVGVPQTAGVVVENVIVLGHQNESPVHALLFENLTGAYFANLYSYLNGIGQVFKVTNSRIDNIHCSGESKCVYIKSDTYAPASNVTLNGLTASYLTTPGDTGGLNINAGSANVDGVQLSNLNFIDTTVGVSSLTDGANGLYVNNVNIEGFRMDDADYAASKAPCFFFYSTGSSTANTWKINNAVCNNVAYAVWMTSNDRWQNIAFTNFSGTNFNSGYGMILSGQNLTVNKATFDGLGTGYGILAEGTSATVINICNVTVNPGAKLVGYVYIDSSPTVSQCTEPQ